MAVAGFYTPAILGADAAPAAAASPTAAAGGTSLDATAPSGSGTSGESPIIQLSPGAKVAAEAGIEALGKNNFDAAQAAFLELLKLSPDNPSALINLGTVELRLGQPEEALKYLERAVVVKPDAGLAWMTLGVAYMNLSNLEGATAALTQAVFLDPKNPQAHNYLAVIFARRGWYDAAEDELQTVVELAPNFAEAHFNLALIYFQRHPPAVELARRHYQKAIELGEAPDPDFEKKLNAAPEATDVQ